MAGKRGSVGLNFCVAYRGRLVSPQTLMDWSWGGAVAVPWAGTATWKGGGGGAGKPLALLLLRCYEAALFREV